MRQQVTSYYYIESCYVASAQQQVAKNRKPLYFQQLVACNKVASNKLPRVWGALVLASSAC